MTEDVQVHLFLTSFLKTLHPRLLLEVCQLFGRTETHRVHIDVNGTLHASSTNVEHPSPVLERIVHQGIRRHGCDGLIPVAHLHGGQGHFHNIPIGTIFRHRNPVARTNHIISSKLDTSHQPLDCILENQHQDGRTGTQPCQDGRRILTDQLAHNDNCTDADHHQLQHLIEALQRAVLHLFVFTRNGINRSDDRANQLHDNHGDIDVAALQYQGKNLRSIS